MLRGVALLFLILGPLGCVSAFRMSAQKNVSYEVNKGAPIYLATDDDVSVQEGNAYRYLQDALINAGFSVTEDTKKALFVMTLAIFDKQELYQGYAPFFEPRVYVGFGTAWRRPYWGHWRRGWWGNPYWYGSDWLYSPYAYDYEERILRIRLFKASDFQKGKFVPVWEGSLASRPDDLDAKLSEGVNSLVEKIGENFKGRVTLKDAP